MTVFVDSTKPGDQSLYLVIKLINDVPAFSFELMFECFAFHQRFIGPVELFVVLKTNPGCNSRSVQWKVPAPFVGHQICNIAFGVLVLVCFVIAFAI